MHVSPRLRLVALLLAIGLIVGGSLGWYRASRLTHDGDAVSAELDRAGIDPSKRIAF
jgi:hypothetical protein